jgi:uncharacterized protein YhbP (UPF0306 family)
MSLKELIEKYLGEAKMMQVATSVADQPWNCTVYFVADEEMNLYWISKPETRHSKEIAVNQKVGFAIPVQFTDLTVVGLSGEGNASEVASAEEIKKAIRPYADKFKRGEDWYKEFIGGKNPHKLYKIKPRMFALFDREHFPDNERQEYNLPEDV